LRPAEKIWSNYIPELFALTVGRNRPEAVTVNITDQCNQKCIYCEIGRGIGTYSNERLTLIDLKWLIDEMSYMKIRRLALCGGEPFLFQDLMKVVEYAASKNITCSITTNGFSLGSLSSRDMELLRVSKTRINISVDSLDEKIYSTTRGVPFKVQNLIESVKALSRNHIPVTFLCVISRFNVHRLYEYLVQSYQCGVKQVLF